MLSWMNDSGFWAISELSGFAEQETLKSWTVVRPTISVVGLIVAWIGATVLPLSPPWPTGTALGGTESELGFRGHRLGELQSKREGAA
jgi:hypothetical protein